MDDDDEAGGPTADLLNYAFDFDCARLDCEAGRGGAASTAHSDDDHTVDSGPHQAGSQHSKKNRTDVLIYSEGTVSSRAMKKSANQKASKSGGWASVSKKPQAVTPTGPFDVSEPEVEIPDADEKDVVEVPDGLRPSISMVSFENLKITTDGVRKIDEKHVARVGAALVNGGRILTPLVADVDGEVVDGRHRFTFLSQEREDAVFKVLCPDGRVPVVRLDYRAADDPERAVLDALRIAQVCRRLTGPELGAAISRLVAIYGEAHRHRHETAPRLRAIERTRVTGHAHHPVDLPAQAAEALRLQIGCDTCGARFAVIGTALFCPACGRSQVERLFDDAMKKVRSKIDAVDGIEGAVTASVGKDEAALVVRSVIESGLQDVVTALQAFATEHYKRRFPTAPPPTRNVFQRIHDGSALWKARTGHGYEHWLSPPDLQRLLVLIQRRHLLSHCDGLVDADYISKTADPTYKAGQRIVVAAADVHEAVALVEKLVNGLREP